MIRLPAFRVTLEPLEEAAEKVRGFKWADKEVGTRHQIGGEPDFIQGRMSGLIARRAASG